MNQKQQKADEKLKIAYRCPKPKTSKMKDKKVKVVKGKLKTKSSIRRQKKSKYAESAMT